jgi:RNA recognition motif-containing protein
MRQYFSQFGTINKLRLSRNRKTGHSKHFAFMEFESSHVAKIVAETMDNYLMFGHILKCKYVPPESLHPETFKGANKRFRVAPHNKMEQRALEAPKSESHWIKKNSKEQTKREKKAEKLKAMGYDIELPNLKNPTDVLQQRESQTVEEEMGPETAEADGKEAGSAETAVFSDEVAASKKKSRKRKTGPHSTQTENEATSTLNTVPGDELAVSKKSKKEKKGPTSSGAEGKDGPTLDQKKTTDPAAAGGKNVSTMNVVPSDEVPLSKKSKKEKKRTDVLGADGDETQVPAAVAKDELAPSKGKSRKAKKEKTVTTEMNGLTVPTVDSNAHTSDPVQPQNGMKGSSEKRDKRKEKREKTKDEEKQLPPTLVGDENAPMVKGKSAKPDSHATMPASDSTKADPSSEHKKKQKKKKAKGEDAPVTTTEKPVIATANADVASAEGPSSSIVPVEHSKGDKGTRRSRKRKSIDAGNEAGKEMAESEPKGAQPLGNDVTDATDAKKAKSMRKKAKKA